MKLLTLSFCVVVVVCLLSRAWTICQAKMFILRHLIRLTSELQHLQQDHLMLPLNLEQLQQREVLDQPALVAMFFHPPEKSLLDRPDIVTMQIQLEQHWNATQLIQYLYNEEFMQNPVIVSYLFQFQQALEQAGLLSFVVTNL